MAVTNLGCVGSDVDDEDRAVFIERPASTESVTWTWTMFDSLCDGIARGLGRAGVGVGDRIGILGLNSVRYLATVYGAARLGAVPVPINMKLPVGTIEYILDDAQIDLLFADDMQSFPGERLGRVVPLEGQGFDEFCDPGPFDSIDPADDQPGLQLYTSGSTGVPKGVLLSHRAKLWTTRAYTPPIPGEQVRSVVASPLCHSNGLAVSTITVAAGGTVALLPRFDATDFLHVVADHSVTVLSGVPTMFAMLLEQTDLVETLDLSSVMMILIGSAPLTDALLQRIKTAFPNAVVTNNYGTTEASALFGPHPEGKLRPFNSLGALLPGTDARLVGGPSAAEGVLEVRGPSVMLGYHNLPEATAARLRNGWYNTGDVLRRDADGFFFFVGRADDMFVCGGENVYPAEVETLLERHPAVTAAGVVSVPDDRKGAVPFAFVTVGESSAVTEEDLKQFALDSGPVYAYPRYVVIEDELPLSPTNKVDKTALAARARAYVQARAAID